MTHRFETPRTVHLRVENAAGEVEIATHQADTTEVELRALAPASEEQVARARVECADEPGEHRVVVAVPSPRHEFWRSGRGVAVRIAMPEGGRLDVMTASSDVSASGSYGGGSIQTGSGDVYWEGAAGDMAVAALSGDVSVRHARAGLKVRSAKGDISVQRASGNLTLETESGDIEAEWIEAGGRLRTSSGDVDVARAAGVLDVTTASGDVTVQQALDDCRLESRSGDLKLVTARAGKVRLETASGDVTAGIAPGSLVSVDAQTQTGDLHSDIPLSSEPDATEGGESPLVTLQARSVTGDIRIRRGLPLRAH